MFLNHLQIHTHPLLPGWLLEVLVPLKRVPALLIFMIYDPVTLHSASDLLCHEPLKEERKLSLFYIQARIGAAGPSPQSPSPLCLHSKVGPIPLIPPSLSSYPGLSSLASTAQAPEVLWPPSTRLPTGRTGKLDSCSQEQGDYVSCDLSDRVKEDTRHSVYRPEGSRRESGGKGVMGEGRVVGGRGG